MMKRFALTLFLGLMLVSVGFSQAKKPAYKKKVPNLQSLKQSAPVSHSALIFQKHLPITTNDEMRTLKIYSDHIGMRHHKYQQFYRGIKVEGATYTLHENKGKVTHMSGEFRAIGKLDTKPALSTENAFHAALKHVNAEKYMWEDAGHSHEGHHHHDHGAADYKKPQGELVVYVDPRGEVAPRLAYKFDIYATAPLYRAYVFIDAQNGKFITDHERIHHVDVNATGNSLYDGNVSFLADNYSGSSHRLRQTTNGVETYNLNNGTSYNNASDFTSSSSSFNNSATGVQAHWGAESTQAYFLSKHNRDSYNGNGAVLRSYVSYSSNYVNAFWDGSRMTYGDGDGVNYGPLVSLDIVGHEITHGVTEYTANLVYSYESGALNESFSDIFGEAIENYATGSNDWQMGTDIGIGGSGAIRSMNNPNAFNDPDTYQGNYWHTASSDNGGVHINSGVQNKWFYILAHGESGTNDNGDAYNVAGIGIDKAAAIAYRNLSVYLSANSNFAAARDGALQAASDLYGAGSAEYNATCSAWAAVGVGPASCAPPTCDDNIQNGDEEGVDCGGSNCAPCPCFDTSVAFTLVTDNYGSETSWTVTNSGGTTVESGSGYANNTTYNLNWNLPAGDYTFTINDSYGDGICCAYGTGSYTLTSGGSTIASGGSFASTESKNFCTGGTTDVPGCTDASAHNYDPNATTDDGSCETCSDNVQNGDETGVDCGGALCNACPPDPVLGCTDASAHNYDPNATQDNGSCETCSDNVLNGDETGVDCGGALCDACPPDPVPGCTDATAHNYDPNATQDDGSCETCSDNVQNGDETGVDCGGSLCSPCGGGGCTDQVVNSDGFESGWGIWNDGGSDARRSANDAAYANTGNYCIRLRDNSGAASSMTTNPLDLSSFEEITISYSMYARSMETNEDYFVEINTGGGYTTIANYARGVDFNNNTRYTDAITVQGPFSSATTLRIRCDASGNSDWIYIDDVTIEGCANATLLGDEPVAMPFTSDEPTARITTEEVTEVPATLSVYPNPTTQILNVEMPSLQEETQVVVYDISGKAVLTQLITEGRTQFDVALLPKGMYFVMLRTNDEVFTQKFLKH